LWTELWKNTKKTIYWERQVGENAFYAKKVDIYRKITGENCKK